MAFQLNDPVVVKANYFGHNDRTGTTVIMLPDGAYVTVPDAAVNEATQSQFDASNSDRLTILIQAIAKQLQDLQFTIDQLHDNSGRVLTGIASLSPATTVVETSLTLEK